MAIYEITGTSILKLEEASLVSEGILERRDLQRLLKESLEVIAPDSLLITEEFGDWEDSKRRIDLLCVDREANLVVIELKRTDDGGHMELQAIRYAAMISAMTFSEVVEAHGRYLKKNGRLDDPSSAILQFLEWDQPSEDAFGRDVRIVLVSAEFSKEVTSAVLWLNNHDLDIRCVRLRPYRLDERILLDVQQIIPLPEAASYQVQLRKKEVEQRVAREFNPDFTRYDLTIGPKTHNNLPKRWLIFHAVQAVIGRGVSPEVMAELLPGGMGRWLQIDALCTEEEFRERAASLHAPQGGVYNLKRYFHKDDELFRVNGKTYAFSNQWSGSSVLASVDRIIENYPDLVISYIESA